MALINLSSLIRSNRSALTHSLFFAAIAVTDFDQDVVTNTINIEITDGDSPVVTNVDSDDVDEAGIVGGSQEGTAPVAGSGNITADIFEATSSSVRDWTTEFNAGGSLTSNGEAVLLELIDETNGAELTKAMLKSMALELQSLTLKLMVRH
ncbi:hypothetical protein OK016_01250 [Vibrio chagasii]|nr:hypothetical protein [Vibrio chagasii]